MSDLHSKRSKRSPRSKILSIFKEKLEVCFTESDAGTYLIVDSLTLEFHRVLVGYFSPAYKSLGQDAPTEPINY